MRFSRVRGSRSRTMAAMLAACGLATALSVQAGAYGDEGDSGTAAGLPLLPPLPEIGAAAGAMPNDLPADPAAITGAYGYVGPFVTEELSANVPVLENTVFASNIGTMRLTGLVRNETVEDIAGVRVGATLQTTLGEVTVAGVPVLIEPVRSGEPVPFSLDTGVAAADVYSYEFTVTYGSPTGETRMLDLQQHFSVPFGDRERGVEYPFMDPPSPPYPYLMFGSVQNASDRNLDAVRVVVAFLDDEHRVIQVQDQEVSVQANTPDPAAQPLPPGVSQDFIFTNDDATTATQLHAAQVAIWGAEV